MYAILKNVSFLQTLEMRYGGWKLHVSVSETRDHLQVAEGHIHMCTETTAC